MCNFLNGLMSDYTTIYNSFLDGRLELFYSEMFPGLLRFSVGVLGDELSYMAEDCLQDVVLAAYVGRRSFKDARHWRTWILTSIHTRAIDLHRKTNSSRNYMEHITARQEINQSVEASLIEQETMDTFFNAIRSLPPKYREIVELSFEQGLKNAEVSRLLGITEVAVRKRKARLIDILREKLGGHVPSATILVMLQSLSETLKS